MTQACTLAEMMVVQAAREIGSACNIFVGMGLPMLATALAKVAHNPELTYSTEVGVGDWRPDPAALDRAPLGIADPVLNDRAAFIGDMVDALGGWLMGGRFDLAVLPAAEVDRFGNLNALLIGDPARPMVRLPGTGGNTDAACLAPRVIAITPLEPRRFVERVSFLSSPGYITGAGARAGAGLAPQGPNLVVTTMGVFGFDTPDGGATGSCEMMLLRTYADVPPDAVSALVPWELRIAPSATVCDPPTELELDLVRRLDPGPFYLRAGRY